VRYCKPITGPSPPEAEALLVFGRSMKATNLSSFLKFGNTKKSDICVIFAKNHGWPMTLKLGRGLVQNWGACALLSLGLKPPLCLGMLLYE